MNGDIPKWVQIVGAILATIVTLVAVLGLIVSPVSDRLENHVHSSVETFERMDKRQNNVERDVRAIRESQIRTEEAIKRLEDKLE